MTLAFSLLIVCLPDSVFLDRPRELFQKLFSDNLVHVVDAYSHEPRKFEQLKLQDQKRSD